MVDISIGDEKRYLYMIDCVYICIELLSCVTSLHQHWAFVQTRWDIPSFNHSFVYPSRETNSNSNQREGRGREREKICYDFHLIEFLLEFSIAADFLHICLYSSVDGNLSLSQLSIMFDWLTCLMLIKMKQKGGWGLTTDIWRLFDLQMEEFNHCV